MRKIMTLGLIILLALGASYIVYASNVANTKHNLSTGAGPLRTYQLVAGTTGDEVCVFCHTPHSGDQTKGPIWNRNYTAPSFDMYNSSTIDMTIEASPVTISLACLSCHDGTTAFDSLLNFPGSADGSDWTWKNNLNTIVSSAISFMGTDLTDDHPISITYDPNATPDPTEWNTANAQNYVNGLPLFNGRVECGSCHNAHDDQYGSFLRSSNVGSAMCLKCHIK